MNAKQIDVTCPCCSAQLSIDVLTGRVMRTSRPRASSESAPAEDRWDVAQSSVRQRTQGSADKLESALEEERGKSARFDELFKKAQEKHGREKADDSE